MNRQTREQLMREVQVYSFMVYDALLYLDSYPDCKEAIEFYNKYKKLEKNAIEEYECKYGEINLPENANSWQWTKGPWPWQNEECR